MGSQRPGTNRADTLESNLPGAPARGRGHRSRGPSAECPRRTATGGSCNLAILRSASGTNAHACASSPPSHRGGSRRERQSVDRASGTRPPSTSLRKHPGACVPQALPPCLLATPSSPPVLKRPFSARTPRERASVADSLLSGMITCPFKASHSLDSSPALAM
jgi:hypothetical protein